MKFRKGDIVRFKDSFHGIETLYLVRENPTYNTFYLPKGEEVKVTMIERDAHFNGTFYAEALEMVTDIFREG